MGGGHGTPLRTQLAEWCTSDEETEGLVTRYREYQDHHLERLTTPYPAVLDTLAWARAEGHPTAIVTSKGRGMTARSLDHVGLSALFDTVVTFEETTRHKPGPEPVLLALDRLEAAPDRALLWATLPTTCTPAGRRGEDRGRPVGPVFREALMPAAPDFWMTSFRELPDIVRQLDWGRPRGSVAGPPATCSNDHRLFQAFSNLRGSGPSNRVQRYRSPLACTRRD